MRHAGYGSEKRILGGDGLFPGFLRRPTPHLNLGLQIIPHDLCPHHLEEMSIKVVHHGDTETTPTEGSLDVRTITAIEPEICE
jgi:hypothetical protein